MERLAHLIFSSLLILACRAQEDSESSSQSPRLISNENSAALTAGALGLGIGVAGSLIVSKLIDDAAKCKPPAIGKLIPLPDLLKFNPINPDCNRQFGQASSYRETYPSQYPSQGYQVPLSSSSYQPVPIQLTPSLQYQDQHTAFSQTSSYTATPNTVRPVSQAPLVPSVVEAYVYPETPQSPSLSYVPNPAIQPRGLNHLFSPVTKQTAQFTETDPVKPHPDTVRTGKALIGPETRQVSGPVLFQPVTKTELDNKAARQVQSGFSQTEAVTPVTDTFRKGKSINDEAEIFVEPREAGSSSERLVASPGFSETEAVVAEPDLARSVQQIKASSGRVLFRPVSQEKLSRQGKSLSEVKPFSKSARDSHPAVAVADVGLSEESHGPRSFSSGL